MANYAIYDVQTKQRVIFPREGQDPMTMPIFYRRMFTRFLQTVECIRAMQHDNSRDITKHARPGG